MKYLITLLLIPILSTCVRAQISKTVSISGKIFRPADTLVLLKPFEDLRYNGVKIPTAADSTFHASFTVDGVEEYQLIFLSEFKNGGWRAVNFFTDAEQLSFELFPMSNGDRNKIYGSDLTDQKAAYRNTLMEQWYPEFMKLEEKASAETSDSLIKVLRDSLLAAMAVWRHETLTSYPAEIALSEYYDALTQYQDNERLRPVMERQHEYWQKKPRINSMSAVVADLYYSTVEKLTGKPFLDFQLYDSAGDSSLFSNEITESGFVLLDLWSPWCGPCIKKSKTVLSSLDELQANDVKVIGIMGGIPTAEKFLRDKSRFLYPWPVYPEIRDRQKIWRRYGFDYGGGGQVLIDGSGIIVAINPSVAEILRLTE